jgi:hypothetical protein
MTDYGFRDWGPDLVHYNIDTKKFRPGKFQLTDSTGKVLASQVNGSTLSFVATLPKGQSVTYALKPGATQAKTTLSIAKKKDGIEIGNEYFAVRCPAIGARTFKTAVAASTIPGPISAWRPMSSTWIGASKFVTSRKVTSYQFSLIEEGPVSARYEARYRFAPQGEYVFRIRVVAGINYADVVEEFDFGEITEGRDFLTLQMQKNFPAQTVGWLGGEGNQLKSAPLQEYLDSKLKANTDATPQPPAPQSGMTLLEKIVPGGHWGDLKGGLQLLGGSAPGGSTPVANTGIAPLHVGSWRRAMAMTVWQHPQDGITVALPISVRPLRWYAEATDDISPFSTHEHDPDLRDSYGRRNWALYFGSAIEKLQRTAGHIGLDRYKEWVLDWDDKTKAADYPRAWFTKAQVARLKSTLSLHPDREALSHYYVFSGNPADATQHAKAAIAGINSQMQYLGDWNVAGLSHYRQSQSFAPVAHLADDALACPQLPADLRTELRRALATGAYLISEPDVNPRGAGVHLGNNNMPINRTAALLYFAGLLPDHTEYS